MKLVQLIHNPGAGEKKYRKKEITGLIRAGGFDCRYFSTKKKKFPILREADLYAIAAGDGTVRKSLKRFLAANPLWRPGPIGILPLGTANNIARALGIAGRDEKMIMRAWHKGKTKKFDLSEISNARKQKIFLESFGLGVLPRLIKEMEREKFKNLKSRAESIFAAREQLTSITKIFEPFYCEIIVDGKKYSGKYLMVEIMNISTIGPNLCLSPFSDPGDGILEIVLVKENEREELLKLVNKKYRSEKNTSLFQTIRGKNIKIKAGSILAHADDKLVELQKKKQVSIRVTERIFNFLVV
jgi:diacylglycerol kinase (ATP)